MWWGVIIGLLGLGAGFFGLRMAGASEERQKQQKLAQAVTEEIAIKDRVIDQETAQRTAQVLATVQEHLKRKDVAAAESLLSRTGEPWEW